MAVTAYVGLPRAGKSYEVVVNVILSAIEQGRDVISNIAGLNEALMHDFLVQEGANRQDLGRLKFVTEEQVKDPNFWLTDKDKTEEEKATKFIKAGDLVALDEIWRFFPPDEKLPKYVQNFFRMHGHFVNAVNGLTCEIALISQHVDDFHRFMKRVIMQTVEMIKNVEIGSDKTYRINIYQKYYMHKKPLKQLGPYKYNPKYFPLYKSNSMNESGIKPREERTEKRNNVLKTKTVMFGVPLGFVMLISAFYYGSQFFFNPEFHNVGMPKDAKLVDSEIPAEYPQNRYAPQQKPQADIKPTRDWRLAGLFGDSINPKALLINTHGESRIVLPKTVSHYADIIEITIYPDDKKFSNEPFDIKEGIL